MSKVYIALAEGFEESEALLPLDILHRAKIEVETVSITDSLEVTSAHAVTIKADRLLKDSNLLDADMLFLPGGMPGSLNLAASVALAEVIKSFANADKYLVAVCAAPLVLGQLGLLQGRKATCYPGFEDKLIGAETVKETVVKDGKIITGCGAGAGFALGAKMVEVLESKELGETILKQMMFQVYK